MEKDEIENEGLDEEGLPSYDHYKSISVTLPPDLVKQIEDRARREGKKKSRVVAEILEKGFSDEGIEHEDIHEALKRIEAGQRSILRALELEEGRATPQALKQSIDREKILKLIKDCIEASFEASFGDEGFEIDGNEGFKKLCQERQLVGDVWTDEYLKIIAPYLKIGYDGYSFTPERKEFIENCAKAMELDDEQKEILSSEFEKLFGAAPPVAAETDEEEW